MKNKVFYYLYVRKYILILLLSFIFFNGCNYNNIQNNLQLYFFYVGEGDSILINDNNTITLIDAGPSINAKELVKYLKNQQINKIDNLILTHPHEDHFGGMNEVLNQFKVINFFSPKVTVDTDDYKYLLYNLKLHNLDIKTIRGGLSINLGKNCIGKFLAPSKEYYDNLNNYSAVLKINYINNSFILCGDCETEEENEILSSYPDIKSDVIKIGHHGSKTASSEEFLKKVSPHIAIISDGIRNKFNHPHKETLDKLKKYNISLYRTDINKTIRIISDGNKLLLSTEIEN